MQQLSEFKNFIYELVDVSSKIILPQFENSELTVELKEDCSPVTIADRNTELALRDLITKKYPKHGIIGEEFPAINEEAEFVWILDPIDGTKSFVSGIPLFGTLICLTQNKKPVLGAIHQPVLKNLIIGDGLETTLNNRPIKVSETKEIEKAIVLATDITHIQKHHPTDNFNQLINQAKLFRTWGDCYGYVLLANGKADVMLDALMNLWDIMALIPIIRGAGGIITTWNGGEPEKAGSCIAANRYLHPYILEKLNS